MKGIPTGDNCVCFDLLLQIAAKGFFGVADVVLRRRIAIDPIGDAHIALENEPQC